MAMITIRQETARDIVAREALLDQAFGEGRSAKTAQRLRDGRLPADGLSFVAAENRRVVGTIRLWNITAGPNRPALLLGPLAVACDRQNRGIGAALMRPCAACRRQARPRGRPAGRRRAVLQPLRLLG